jgi:hypothetical protein
MWRVRMALGWPFLTGETNRVSTGRTIMASFAALLAVFVYCAPGQAQAPSAVQPVKRHAGVGNDPFSSAQIQIARLRQTASQLRLLADQPVPANLAADARTEFEQHRQWLREAEQRVSVLASQWEDQLKPLSQRNAVGPAIDMNTFFASQSETLQTKLRRESLAQRPASETVRSSGATARLVISKMY